MKSIEIGHDIASMRLLHSVHIQCCNMDITQSQVPREKICLAMTPTPIHRWNISGLPDGLELHIKRDDLTGMQLSGNKVRRHANHHHRLQLGGCTQLGNLTALQHLHRRLWSCREQRPHSYTVSEWVLLLAIGPG
jgi:hypothetical protein